MIHDIHITITDNPDYMPSDNTKKYWGEARFLFKDRKMVAVQGGNNIPVIMGILGIAIAGTLDPDHYEAIDGKTVNEYLNTYIHE